MCCCGKPTVNGESGYKWNQPDAAPSVYPVNPPPLEDGDELLFDEPGRCGGTDSHAYHYRMVKHCGLYLLVRHGGGDRRIYLSSNAALVQTLNGLDSAARYWILSAIYHAHHDGARDARESESETWRTAAAEKRIKTRKLPARGVCKVWIELAAPTAAAL